ncbi:roadblock/LC7 domain-containing protein [Pseudomonas matsuisoli]|uniref:Roadblock/LAMTOR2 domain-containing protein n=1 Tax=Pseudomonas matsuisoli TaxID=1515666 RepID=A0A917PZN1_9PSED|nr:roadblock/LC7 domain-containing protein [Pseudomonas matsuisoli]GGK01200.1 hypothetical protein GCM10009304_28730 [Pseudomonas matsuisoli]
MNAPTISSPLRTMCLGHLETLQKVDHFRMAAVCSTDGFPIATLGADPQQSRRTTAMAAALDGLSKSITQELSLGTLEGTVLECELGLVLCRQVHASNRNLVLLMVLSEQATYGQALWAIKNTAREMAASLQQLVEQNASL